MHNVVMFPHPHSCLREVCPHCDLLPRAHVRVAIPLEGGLELLQLLAREVRPLPPRLLLLRVVRLSIIAAVLHGSFFFCQKQPEEILFTGRICNTEQKDHDKESLGLIIQNTKYNCMCRPLCVDI